MAAILKLMVLSLCLNTFLYIGMNFAMENDQITSTSPKLTDDLFDILLRNKTQMDNANNAYVASLRRGSTNQTVAYAFNLTTNFSAPPSVSQGSSLEPEQGGFAFIDGLRTVFAFGVTLWNIALSPLLIFTQSGLPPFFAIIIGLPLMMLQVTVVVIFFRGGGAI